MSDKKTKVGIGYGFEPWPYTYIHHHYKGISDSVQLTDIFWYKLEPRTDWPKGWPEDWRYNLGFLQSEIASWEAAGYKNFIAVLRVFHPSYTQPKDGLEIPKELLPACAQADAPLKDNNAVVAFQRMLRYVVSKTKTKIRRWKICSAQTDFTHFLGDWQEYLQILSIAYGVIKSVDPDIEVIIGGVEFGDLLDDAPSITTLKERIAKSPAPFDYIRSRALDFGINMLQYGIYDAADIHSLSGTMTDKANVELGMESAYNLVRGYARPDSKIYVCDANSGPSLIYSDLNQFNDDTEQRMLERLSLIQNGDKATTSALRVLQNKITLRKCQTAVRLKIPYIGFCSLTDWLFFSTYCYMGLVDRNTGLQRTCCESIRLFNA